MTGNAWTPNEASGQRLPRAAATRLSLYLRRVEQLLRAGATKVSSREIGHSLGVTDAQVRKDLAALGRLGQPGIGYDTHDLALVLRQTLGLHRTWAIVLVGVGNLARALLRYRGFREQGFHIVALADADPAKIGQTVEGLVIHSPEKLPELVAQTGAELAIITVPSENAQAVADQLVGAGIRGILNFAPAILHVPPGICLVSVDLTVQLEQLAFLVQAACTQGNS
ncbi:MAG: redox-sensing transcriptional repressor Rex [Gemmataceae bacterium]